MYNYCRLNILYYKITEIAMKKKIVAIILILLFVFSVPASAYQITGYELHSDAALLVSLDTDDVLYSHNADKRLYPASITKLMTAIVMVENIPDMDNTYITYTKEANNLILGTGSVVYNLNIGEKMKAKEALASLLIASHGDVAYAIAEYVGGTIPEFVDMMNEKAKELGLDNTQYMNPVGLHDDDHYTTANDIYVLAKYAYNIPIIKEISSKATYSMEATAVHAARTIANSNLLLNPNSNVFYKPTVCGKTGFTDEAGRCLVSIASNSGYNYMAIVLNAKTVKGARNDFIDSANMYRWAFNNFEYKTVLGNTTPVAEMPVELSKEADFVKLTLEGGLEALLPKKADSSTISVQPSLMYESVDAPISKGDVMGTADIYYAEEKIGTVNLVAANDVEVSKMMKFMRDAKEFLKHFFTSPIMIIIYILFGAFILGFIALTLYLNLNKKKRRKVKYKPMQPKDYND